MTTGNANRHLLVWVPVLMAVGVLQSVGAEQSALAPPLSIVKVAPRDLGKSTRTAVVDDSMMTVVEGKGATVVSDTPYVSTDKRFQVDVSAYDRVTLALKDWPVDEFMYFLEGQVEIADAHGHKHVYERGDAILMPRGFSGTWRQITPIKKISAEYWPGASAPVRKTRAPEVIQVDLGQLHAAAMAPVTGSVPFARVLNGGKSFVELPVYRSADGELAVDAKKYGELELELKGWPGDEFMVLLSGEVEIVDAAGRATPYKAGDAFVIPRGFVGVWRQRSRIEMLTVNREPRSNAAEK